MAKKITNKGYISANNITPNKLDVIRKHFNHYSSAWEKYMSALEKPNWDVWKQLTPDYLSGKFIVKKGKLYPTKKSINNMSPRLMTSRSDLIFDNLSSFNGDVILFFSMSPTEVYTDATKTRRTASKGVQFSSYKPAKKKPAKKKPVKRKK